MPSATTDDDRPRRADARRNRERVLQAAEAVFTEQGTAASTNDVAKRAGVGIGTVFRHFPTKDALLEAVFVERLRRLAEQATAATGADHPGDAFFTFFAEVVEQAGTKNALTEALAAAGIDSGDLIPETRRALRRAFGDLLSQAQDAGAVRADLTGADLTALLVGASHAAEHARNAKERRRVVQVITDGLRPRQ